MNTFEFFDIPEYEHLAVLNDCEKDFTIKDIKKIISPLVRDLLLHKKDNVVITSQNPFNFVLNFLASVFAQKEIFLFSDLKKLSGLEFDYILLDKFVYNHNEDCAWNYEKADTENTFINFFTSGSSGTPKQIRKNPSNIIAEANDILFEFEDILKTDKEKKYVITSTSTHHMFGMTFCIFVPFCSEGRLVFNTREVLYPDKTQIKDTIFVSTPSFLEKYKKYEIDLKKNLPDIIITAGDKLKDEVYDYFEKHNARIKEVYGSTESGVVGYKSAKDNTFFKCFRNVRIAADKNSQIVISSPYFMEKSTVLCDIIDIKDEKYFHLHKRSDRIVKIQEKRVSTQEIENHLNESVFVDSSYCFKYAEKLACAVVLSEEGKKFYLDKAIDKGRQNLIKTLKSFLKEKSEIVPQKWRFVPEIPKTKSGKTDKEKIEGIFNTNISLPLVLNMKKSENEAEYELIFSKSCNFFDGHFEDLPILPGVVQLYFAHKFACEAFEKKIKESPAKKVKFSHLIGPDEILKLHIKLNDSNVMYTYKKDELNCSSGVFSIME